MILPLVFFPAMVNVCPRTLVQIQVAISPLQTQVQSPLGTCIYVDAIFSNLENSELRKTNSMLKVYKLVLKISPEKF